MKRKEIDKKANKLRSQAVNDSIEKRKNMIDWPEITYTSLGMLIIVVLPVYCSAIFLKPLLDKWNLIFSIIYIMFISYQSYLFALVRVLAKRLQQIYTVVGAKCSNINNSKA